MKAWFMRDNRMVVMRWDVASSRERLLSSYAGDNSFSGILGAWLTREEREDGSGDGRPRLLYYFVQTINPSF
jgi:hypothetical protein